MTSIEKGVVVKSAIHWIYRIVSGGISRERYLDGEQNALYEKVFHDYYSDKIIITELGKSTTLVEIPDADFERLIIGGNEKFVRLGCLMVVSLQNSVPMDLARARVQERLDKLNIGLRLDIYSDDSDNYDDGGELIDIVRRDGSDETWCQGDIIYIPDLVPEGKSMLNRNKDHYGWLRLGVRNVVSSVDRSLFTLLEKIEAGINECVGCGSLVVSARVCPLCQHKYRECSECGAMGLVKDGGFLQSRFLCGECKAKPKCRGCGYPVEASNSTLCERCSRLRGILDYHSHVGRQDESGGSRFKVGIEVEKEDYEVREAMNCRAILRDTGWAVERDGSLGDYGFEMISPIYPLDIGEVRKRILPLKKEMGAKVTNRCGGHIHVSDTERTPYDILLDIRGYLPLLYGLYPQRATNEYCEAKETPEYIEQGHRQALNITGRTLEFRIFPAVKNMEQLLFRLELVEYMLNNRETDVIKVGEALLDKDSRLYKILRQRISDENLKIKAKAFIDFTNYLGRDALVLEGNKIRRVISIPKIKEDKERLLEEKVKVISDGIRLEGGFRGTEIRPILARDYGYFANLIED